MSTKPSGRSHKVAKKTGPPKARPVKRMSAEPVIVLTPTLTAKQLTDMLKSVLQTDRIAFLTVGKILAIMRDEKRYAELGFADLESYSEKCLDLRRSSLFNYLRIFDWVNKNHPEWIDPAPGCFIPDLFEVDALIWIDEELGRKDIRSDTQQTLEDMRKKAQDGTLTEDELIAFKKRQRAASEVGLKGLLTRLIRMRRQAAQEEGIASAVLTDFDRLIDDLKRSIP